MKSYRELEVYKISKSLAIRIHRMSLALPKFELYEEGSQIRRSSKAVTSAIVEGYGRRNYKPEFLRYLTFALTECDETILHLEFLFETESLKNESTYKELIEEYQQLSKRLNAFMQWVDKNWLIKPKQ
ncbi:MAG: four helix bundle protein [Chitinophagaceae bacterium]|nr:four helix bundle protein [Chitinophagaceae bacterium]